jgi:ketosteroid isomerase-like protein
MIRASFLAMSLAAVAAIPLHAQAAPDPAKTINDLEVRWGASMAAKNWAATESFLSPDFFITDGDGTRKDRTAYMSFLKDSGTTLSDIVSGPYRVVVSGGTAIHLGEWDYTVTDKEGKATRQHEVWTDTWVLMANGQWLCIAVQYMDQPIK